MSTKLSLSPFVLYRYHHSVLGTYIALVVSIGHKWIHYVAIGYPITVKRVSVKEAKFFTDIGYKGNAKAKYIELAARMGITKGAAKHLKEEV